MSHSSKVNPYRDVVKKEGVVVKEEDQLDVDGRNLVIEHSWGALKVKNVVASLVKLIVMNACDEWWLELGGSYWLELACLSIRLGLSAE
ncbi:hypothetical protein Bca52824_094091 [Brassica carinata]|uniref:Uncharacterized protein n=1 Tax=Brassica carinata TaxID=52824 RepID=A0A8X7P500_BRACI|nr:hypothetical protein Bca52824_094091 [Brassica carinata]